MPATPPPSDVPESSFDERDLWSRLAKGDRSAAERLAEGTYRMIYGALFKLTGGNEDLAADLTQETYRKAWRSLARFKGGAKFSTWLYRIAYNTFLNHVRGPRRVVQLDEERAAEIPDRQPSQDDELGRAGEDERLRRAVLGLPEELRFAVTARYWGDVPVREIARQQGLSPVGVRKRLLRAYSHLATTLEEMEQ